MAKLTFTADDGSTQEFDVTVVTIPAIASVPETEVAKVEAEVAAVDTELKADETPTD